MEAAGRALILDPGGSRGALAAVRSLGRAGWAVGVASPRPSLATRSRFAARSHPVPSPLEDEAAFVAAVAGAVGAGGYDVVLPSGDAEAIVASRDRESFGAAVPYAAHEVVETIVDKARLSKLAEQCGIAVPDVGVENLPLIVKPASHGTVGDGQHRLEAVVVRDASELDAAVRRITDAGGEPLVQEFLRGELVAMAVVAGDDGSWCAHVQQRATHVWPAPAGVSARAETVEPDPSLSAAVELLLRTIGWRGLVQLQFLVPNDGTPRLIDGNCRLYGSIALAMHAGVDIPRIWAESGLRRPGGCVTARRGHRYQWLEGDLRRAVAERRGGIARDVAGTVRSAAGAAHSILDAGDVRPAIAHSGDLIQRALRKTRWSG